MFKKISLSILLIVSILSVIECRSLSKTRAEAVTIWSKLDAQLARRLELVSDLSITMRKFIQGKEDVFNQIDARLKEIKSFDSHSLPNATEFNQLLSDQNYLTQARTNLMDLAWTNEILRADGGFRNIQDQGDRIENRLIVQKGNFIFQTGVFNQAISRFPTSILASVLGFTPIPTFESPYWSGPVPQNFVDFSK